MHLSSSWPGLILPTSWAPTTKMPLPVRGVQLILPPPPYFLFALHKLPFQLQTPNFCKRRPLDLSIALNYFLQITVFKIRVSQGVDFRLGIRESVCSAQLLDNTYTSHLDPNGVIVGKAALQVRRQLAWVDVLGQALQTGQVRLRMIRISYHRIWSANIYDCSICQVSSEPLVMLVDQLERSSLPTSQFQV